jgi:hypothetical protein
LALAQQLHTPLRLHCRSKAGISRAILGEPRTGTVCLMLSRCQSERPSTASDCLVPVLLWSCRSSLLPEMPPRRLPASFDEAA